MEAACYLYSLVVNTSHSLLRDRRHSVAESWKVAVTHTEDSGGLVRSLFFVSLVAVVERLRREAMLRCLQRGLGMAERKLAVVVAVGEQEEEGRSEGRKAVAVEESAGPF